MDRFNLLLLSINLMENWHKIKNTNGLYWITKTGRVKVLARTISFKRKGKLILRKLSAAECKVIIDERGYKSVAINVNSNKKCIRIHRILADLFIPRDKNRKLEVNHKDGVKLNNDISNLEWVTHGENVIHAEKMGLFRHPKGEEQINAKLTEKDVIEIREQYHLHNKSAYSISRERGINESHIWSIVNNVWWKHIPMPSIIRDPLAKCKLATIERVLGLISQGVSIKEAANILGVNQGTIRNRIRSYNTFYSQI